MHTRISGILGLLPCSQPVLLSGQSLEKTSQSLPTSANVADTLRNQLVTRPNHGFSVFQGRRPCGPAVVENDPITRVVMARVKRGLDRSGLRYAGFSED
jgi:hypothetical protein